MYRFLFLFAILPAFFNAFTIKPHPKVQFISEIHDIDVQDVDIETMDQLRFLMDTTPVLVFKNQRMNPRDQFRFCIEFDRQHTTDVVHPFEETKVPTCPQIALRGTGRVQNLFGVIDKPIRNSKAFKYTRVWHQDLVGTKDRYPTKISSIHMLQPSKTGGSTLFASMEKAYENMGNDFKKYNNLQVCYSSQLGLSALMDHTGYCRIDKQLKYNMETLKKLQDDLVIQPLVAYPDASRRKKTLMLNPAKFCGFFGMPFEKSRHVLNTIMNKYVLTDNNIGEVHYDQYDLVVFNNRRVIHSSTPTAAIEGNRIISLLLLDTKEPYVSLLPPVFRSS
jgi:alpha-ketoglutarate-dependent taurine dioxygenase